MDLVSSNENTMLSVVAEFIPLLSVGTVFGKWLWIVRLVGTVPY